MTFAPIVKQVNPATICRGNSRIALLFEGKEIAAMRNNDFKQTRMTLDDIEKRGQTRMSILHFGDPRLNPLTSALGMFHDARVDHSRSTLEFNFGRTLVR